MDGAFDHSFCMKLIGQVGENLFVLDRRGRFTFVNRHALRASGYRERDIIGRKFSAIVAPASRAAAAKAFRGAMRGRKVPPLEIEAIYKGGRRAVLELRGEPLREGGKIIGAIGATRDITARKRAEAAIRESGEMYRALVEALPRTVVMTDLRGRITYASPQAARAHGFRDAAGMLGMSAFRLIAPRDRARAAENMAKTVGSGVVRGVEYELLRRDGTTYPAELDAVLVRGHDGAPKGFIATTADITAWKLAEEELKRRISELEKFRKFAVGRELKMVELKKRLRAVG